MIEQGKTVTWEARHLFKKRYLKMAITHMQPYSFFQDEMIEGDFKKITHVHHFKQAGSKIMMTDIFVFETPFIIIGHLVNVIFLTGYMRCLLISRNSIIKQYAETEQWKTILDV